MEEGIAVEDVIIKNKTSNVTATTVLSNISTNSLLFVLGVFSSPNGIGGHHSRFDVIGDVTVDHPGARIIGDHVCSHHAPRQ